MKAIMTRLFTVALLMMVSIGAGAQIKVLFGEKGTELQPDKDGTVTLGEKELTGGTIIISQEDQKDGTVKVTLAVAPASGYTLAKDGLEAYAVASADISSTRAVTASDKLDLKSDDFKDISSKRTYTVTIDQNLGLWVKSATFQRSRDSGAVKAQSDVTPQPGKLYMFECLGVIRYQGEDNQTQNTSGYPHPFWLRPNNDNNNSTQKIYHSFSPSSIFYIEESDTEGIYYIRNWKTDFYMQYTLRSRSASSVRMVQTSTPGDLHKYKFHKAVNDASVNANYNSLYTDYGIMTYLHLTNPIKLNYDTLCINPADRNRNNVGLYRYNSDGSQWDIYEVTFTDITGTTEVTGETTIRKEGTYSYSAKDIPDYTSYEVKGAIYYGVHNWCNNEDYGAEVPGTTITNGTWSLSDNAVGYATVNASTGELTVSSLPTSSNVTMTLTYTYEIEGVEKTVTKEVTLVGVVTISTLNDITSANGNYRLASNFTLDGTPEEDGVEIGTATNLFRGTIDGQIQTFSGWSSPLFKYVQDATIKNITIESADIYTDGDAGAIACIANGASRIYNIGIRGGSVSGTDNVGGIVGTLDGTSRVINCYSFADITGGTTVGGIVGNNRYATTADNLGTMVMNCMMYGDITGGSNVYPVYGGTKINNAGEKGVNNYNYYRDEAAITISDMSHYNCSWPAEEEYLTRFDYFRSILNANRELCAWWITGNADDTDEVAKWVYAPQEAKYPILKPWGRYPSMINRDIDGQSLYPRSANAYEGRTMGRLNVSVESGKGASESLQLTITDIDSLHYDYGYYKVQLPYYNDVFGAPNAIDFDTRYGGNYGDQVVTGWDVISVTDGTEGTFSTDPDSGYNFADRHCTQKDLYSVSGRVFAQGGYFYVPEGVTAITIRAHWAKAYYCINTDYARDRINFSIASDNAVTSHPFTPFGTINTFNGRTVYAGLKVAQQAINSTGGTGVYDNAIVLVGNVQHCNGGTNDLGVNYANKGFTIMSVDLDMDCEPDYVLPLQSGNYSASKQWLSPIRFDFVQVPDLGMALKLDGTGNRLAIACIKMYGHFEITETASLHFNEIYFGNASANRKETPLILNGGQFMEFVCMDGSGKDNAGTPIHTQDKTLYIIAGGNVKMRSLYQGNHNLQTYKIKHAPMNVIGGDIEECYLSGNLRSMSPSEVWEDNPHLFTNGGHFGIIAGAGQESVKGDVHYKIDHSLIDEFYGGATSDGGQITGSIDVQIDNSLVGLYCGGPMVGNMPDGKTITTRATGSTFHRFFGAGNGGTSFTLLTDRSADLGAQATRNPNNGSWWLESNYKPMRLTDGYYEAKYHFEIWTTPSGTRNTCASRRYVYGAQFAATHTGSVTSVLNGCTFLGDFFGGGNLGSVNGDVTSTLTGCTVHGNAYGAGFSATVPSFDCYEIDGLEYPWQEPNTSICHGYKVNNFTRYTWTNEGENGDTFTRDGINYVHTDNSLEHLGVVQGNATLNIAGTTTVHGSVFGGGDESATNGNTKVTLSGDTKVHGDVYGGGALANTGDTQVNLTGGVIEGNVYGGGMGRMEVAAVGTEGEEGYVAAVTAVEATVGSTLVNLNGTVTKADDGTDRYLDDCVVKGNIFGCNNVNGTPLGNATVHIYKTQGYEGHIRTDSEKLDNANDSQHSYELNAVYGGGNLAAHKPTELAYKATVIIDGCELTSIKTVYGGGNAASVPATDVLVNGTYEIEEVFGGGNGKDAITINNETKDNPGANVGYLDYSAYETSTDENKGAATKELRIKNYQYGSGAANVDIRGGTIHRVFGGSNTKGNVRITAVTMLAEESCSFDVDEAYGGGKSAPMDAEAKLMMACIPGLDAAYGGAQEADVQGGVTLTITNGTFDRVFGGNNISGTIGGPIVVNIEETGCKPIVIGKLYGGGNEAPYSVYGYDAEGQVIETGTKLYKDPIVNIKSFTSIGDVYGGGYGETAKMVGSPTVNINVAEGEHSDTEIGENVTTETYRTGKAEAEGGYPVPSHAANSIGAINNVYGGGDAAPVIGNTNVNIGTMTGNDVYMAINVEVGEPVGGYFTRSGEGTTSSPYTYTAASGTAQTGTTYYKKYEVLGADIRGNVYGGGNNAEVTGNTNVVIGAERQ